MTSIRQRVVEFFRHFSTSLNEDTSENFIQNYLKGKDVRPVEPDTLHAKEPQQLPPRVLRRLSREVLFALTGPDEGLTAVNKQQKHISVSDPDVNFIDDNVESSSKQDGTSSTDDYSENYPIQKSESAPVCSEIGGSCEDEQNVEMAGVCDWRRGDATAFGASTSLYEMNPVTGERAGEPIADCFAIVARRNSALMALADGVNWGEKARVAARSAIHGCIEYLNKALFPPAEQTFTTTDVFRSLLRSFNAAHNMILLEGGMLTTLTAVVVLPLASQHKYIACCCNVGDSLAYVFNPRYGVREITQGSHDVHSMRDMRDALGALGPVDGQNPELTNLTLAMTEVEPGDLVFLTSDGVSDNLDPVIGKFAGLPTVEAYQRHRLSLLRTEDLLRNGVSGKGPAVKDARALVTHLLEFVTRLTAAKRRILEDGELYVDASGATLSRVEQRVRRKRTTGKLATIPGKLDHATVVAFVVPAVPGLSDLNIDR